MNIRIKWIVAIICVGWFAGGGFVSSSQADTIPGGPQCITDTSMQNCVLENPQEAACNEISCVNSRCHYVGKASGEYTWVNEPGKRSHHPLPTNFPPCDYPGKPPAAVHAYCTNAGLSGLDYCFPAEQPRASNTTTPDCAHQGTTIMGFANVGCMNFGPPGPGSTLVCPDGKSPTPSCSNYDMDPVLVAGQPAFPPDCCQ